MQESYKFQVNCRGGDGFVFEISPNQTILHMMSLICEEWLDDYRDGDGAVYDHLWKFMHHSDDIGYEANETAHQWTDEQATALDNYLTTRNEFPDSLPINVSLKRFQWWNVGTSVPVEYDYGSTTRFEVRLVAKERVDEEIVLPRIAPDAADKLAETFCPFVPKERSPTLNDLFPHANRAMFEMGSKWLCPYPCSDTSGGFVEGRGGDSDLLFLPDPFESLQHALIAMNRAAEEFPDETGCSRSVFAIELTERVEDYYTQCGPLVQEYLDFVKDVDQRSIRTASGAMDMRAVGQLSENIQYRLFCPQTKCFYRLTKEDVEEFEERSSTTVDEIFPLSAKAYKNGLWASYHRGKVKICKGSDTGERGVPRAILAQVARECYSLHDFFCVTEALFQMEKTNALFSALKKTAELDPLLINVNTKGN
ncbi:MAG: hypothetical protein SGBAC_006157 [Bacillariaceae sp.]